MPDFVNGAVGDFNNAKSTSSPLILDLDGDGVETVSLTQAGGVVGDDAVYWDIDNDGFRKQVHGQARMTVFWCAMSTATAE